MVVRPDSKEAHAPGLEAGEAQSLHATDEHRGTRRVIARKAQWSRAPWHLRACSSKHEPFNHVAPCVSDLLVPTLLYQQLVADQSGFSSSNAFWALSRRAHSSANGVRAFLWPHRPQVISNKNHQLMCLWPIQVHAWPGSRTSVAS